MLFTSVPMVATFGTLVRNVRSILCFCYLCRHSLTIKKESTVRPEQEVTASPASLLQSLEAADEDSTGVNGKGIRKSTAKDF